MHATRALVAASLAAGALLTTITPAQAASSIQLGRIYYDSPGSDTGSNSSLNAEYVTIKNTASWSVSLKGWKLKDKTGYTYTFGTYSLGAGKSVRIHTGKGTNTTTDRYWGRSWYVWNNTGDTAYLRNGAGTLKDSCSWSSVGSGYKYC